MNYFGIVIFVISVVSRGHATEILIDEATSIDTINASNISANTISGTDVSNETAFPENLRSSWCLVVNGELCTKFGMTNGCIESVKPGRGYTYEIDMGGALSYAHGFVCAGDPKSFLVVVTEYISATSSNNKFHGYTPESSSSSITYFTDDHLQGVYGLQAQ